MSSRQPCVIANWKMQGSFALIHGFLSELSRGLEDIPKHPETLSQMVLCPPFVYCETVNTELKRHRLENYLSLGAQNVYAEQQGAFTGEISPQMLKEVGCQYVIIGHSERRKLFLEDDALIARKCKAAYDAKLVPVLCIGETEQERAEDKTFDVIARQLMSALERLPENGALSRLMIAYEPVWAIGTGLSATPLEAEGVHAFIRELLVSKHIYSAQDLRILYGGSVNPRNAEALLEMPNIDGALVGGASLVASDFLAIYKASLRWNK